LGDISTIKGDKDKTLLMYAAAHNSTDILEWLIANTKIDINASEKDTSLDHN
jgi:hypothetical protein